MFLSEFVDALVGPERDEIERLLGEGINAKTFQNLDRNRSKSIDLAEFTACNNLFYLIVTNFIQ